MPSVWVDPRRTRGGQVRYRVVYRNGGRGTSQGYAGTFRSRREADLRVAAVRAELAALNMPVIPRNVSITTYDGVRIGRVYRMKYTDADGRQVMVTLGRERDGFTSKDARDAAARFILNTRANPINPLLLLADTLIKKQEKEYGEALPHLYVARAELERLANIASAELAADPTIFDREAAAA